MRVRDLFSWIADVVSGWVPQYKPQYDLSDVGLPSYTHSEGMWIYRAPRQPFRCPVCEGTGNVSRPPSVPGDATSRSSGSLQSFPCQACAGVGIVWSPESE